MSFINAIRKYFFGEKDQPLSESEIESLRLDFKVRYHSFKLLIRANNKALESMADIEKALVSKEPFGMSFVRTRVTVAVVSVFSMINYMKTIAAGKYDALDNSFVSLQSQIESLLAPRKNIEDKRLVIPFSEVGPRTAGLVGQKMANVADVKNRLGIHVPEGFVITASAYELFMEENRLQAEIDRLYQSLDIDSTGQFDIISSAIRKRIMESPIPEDLIKAINDEWEKLEHIKGRPLKLALRSSAIGEDSHESSFAGQYRSVLNVCKNSVFDAYKEVVASKYSVQAINYKLNRGFIDDDLSMCVGCMEMIGAVSGGVVYTGNPVDDRDTSVYINAALGLPLSVVDGSDTSDLFVLKRKTDLEIAPEVDTTGISRNIFSVSKKVTGTLIRSDIREKKFQAECTDTEGVHRVEVSPDSMALPALSNDKIDELFTISMKIEEHYGGAQDIEWALDSKNRLIVLQCRPLKQLHIEDTAEDIEEIKHMYPILEGGITASPGVACGVVYRISRMADIFQFPEGGVMVVEQALPAWASMISRASALISEQGSFAGHLANVAREFKVPAIFAVKDAITLLPHGETVTIDADTKKIYLGRIDALLARKKTHHNTMEGSRVYEVLKKLSQIIVPLQLINPESPDFLPENCRTLHDITRFIHEKSVHEMFNFGKEHNFSQHSSKQLHYFVPMKWWILNLDDGFNQDVNGKYVKIEQIQSIPMLAFWKGFTIKPWDGPPALDGKGFTAVMFQSTTQPALAVGTANNKYADWNYFMLSKNYCSLNSRLGYHFATMEALVSDRSGENYVSFQFKGGAADNERRIKRVHFIKEILEIYGFRVSVNQDNLVSRIEGHEKTYMEQRLEIIGYLTLHTRQLDMIMTNPARVKYYHDKITGEIDSLIINA